ncbi:HWE histidine kinase domain-containing protein [Parvularcula oceani]|uniref:HWE histidine kinase domain-containing protein n=1 Tax=Parvularcula oceani TaxID=1247963 RepID=UPI0004E25BE0|nr:HWE histidine kinase domain-containing protein [Parvularcula oceani]
MNEVLEKQAVPDADLTNCDREPIHIPGGIQPFGVLVAMSSDWIVAAASRNVSDVLPVAHEDLIGSRLSDYLIGEAAEAIADRMRQLGFPDAVERVFQQRLIEGGRPYDMAIHVSGSRIVIEMEPSQGGRTGHDASRIRPLIDRLNRARTPVEMCDIGARQVQLLTGFSRVMIYKFAEDGAGEVVAEARADHLEPFLNLRYPATDIPKQARALYLRNLLRIMPDVSLTPVPVEPYLDPDGKPLDLSLSTLRAVSPVHIEYLRNMGVGASMSISIIQRGKLWGLIACHHDKARVLPYSTRTLCELFGQFFSYALEQKEADLERVLAERTRASHQALSMILAEGGDFSENFDQFAKHLGSVIPFDGLALSLDGEIQTSGSKPAEDDIRAIIRFLNRGSASEIFATDHLAGHLPEAERYADRAAGILALPISRTPRDHLILFRQEVARTVTWAGRPDKAVEEGPSGPRLSPRKSFAAWQEAVAGRSEPWSAAERAAAEDLRVTMLEVILRLSDEAARERKAAQERQELLIAELNHRVRNILNLIRGLVSQSRGNAETPEDFMDTVGHRIQALARAHDQVTEKQWQAGSLCDLIETEAKAYCDEKSDRVEVRGPDVLIEPLAFTTVSLVIHELLTNAMKYGSLSDSRGSVQIDLALNETGALVLEWQERNGPPVQAPKRRGFGSTIIERSIPFDLKGQAELTYELSGLRGRFVIPAGCVAGTRQDRAGPGDAAGPAAEAGLHGRVLIVEDNMIIGLDAEMMAQDLGGEEVVLTSSVGDALSAIETERPDFALLDVNLGSETSQPVAERLEQDGVPFVFATGYGEADSFTSEFDVPILRKPYVVDAVRKAFAEAQRA